MSLVVIGCVEHNVLNEQLLQKLRGGLNNSVYKVNRMHRLVIKKLKERGRSSVRYELTISMG